MLQAQQLGLEIHGLADFLKMTRELVLVGHTACCPHCIPALDSFVHSFIESFFATASKLSRLDKQMNGSGGRAQSNFMSKQVN
jgi:hypothetical protein